MRYRSRPSFTEAVTLPRGHAVLFQLERTASLVRVQPIRIPETEAIAEGCHGNRIYMNMFLLNCMYILAHSQRLACRSGSLI